MQEPGATWPTMRAPLTSSSLLTYVEDRHCVSPPSCSLTFSLLALSSSLAMRADEAPIAEPTELPCHRCSLSYKPPTPAPSSPSDARWIGRAPLPFRCLFRPPERHHRQFGRPQAAGSYGRPPVGSLHLGRAPLQVRAAPFCCDATARRWGGAPLAGVTVPATSSTLNDAKDISRNLKKWEGLSTKP